MKMLFIEVWGLLDSEHGSEEMSNIKWCLFFFDDASLSSDCNVDAIDVAHMTFTDVAHMTFTNIVFFPCNIVMVMNWLSSISIDFALQLLSL